MAITVKCGACGSTAQAPDSAAGAKGKCRACGAVVQIPRVGAGAAAGAGGGNGAGAAPQKVCTACGVDVAGKKRTKDPKGNYYCQPCWDEKVRAGVAVPVTAGARAGAQGGAGIGAAAVAGVGATGAATGADESVDFPCSVCGVLGGPDDVYDDNGRYVCKACWDAQESGAATSGHPDPVWTPDQPPAALPPLPPLPPLPGGAPAAAVAAPPPVPPELLFCEGCGGSFTINHLTTTPDGAVLCKDCIAQPAPAARPAFTPAAPAFVPRPAKEKGTSRFSGFGGSIAAGGGGFLVVLLIVGKIALRGCATYERQQRRERDSQRNVPSQVEEDPDAMDEGEEE